MLSSLIKNPFLSLLYLKVSESLAKSFLVREIKGKNSPCITLKSYECKCQVFFFLQKKLINNFLLLKMSIKKKYKRVYKFICRLSSWSFHHDSLDIMNIEQYVDVGVVVLTVDFITSSIRFSFDSLSSIMNLLGIF